MFNEADVDGSPCEQAAGEHSNEFGDLVHRGLRATTSLIISP